MCDISNKQIKPPKYAYKVVGIDDGKYVSPFIKMYIEDIGKQVPFADVVWNPVLTDDYDCTTAFVKKKDAVRLLEYSLDTEYTSLYRLSRRMKVKVVRLAIEEDSKCFVGSAIGVSNYTWKDPRKIITIAVNKFKIDKEY